MGEGGGGGGGRGDARRAINIFSDRYTQYKLNDTWLCGCRLEV